MSQEDRRSDQLAGWSLFCAASTTGDAVFAAFVVGTTLSTAGAVVFCVLIAGYGLLGSPILGLADQGAEALGLR